MISARAIFEPLGVAAPYRWKARAGWWLGQRGRRGGGGRRRGGGGGGIGGVNGYDYDMGTSCESQPPPKGPSKNIYLKWPRAVSLPEGKEQIGMASSVHSSGRPIWHPEAKNLVARFSSYLGGPSQRWVVPFA